MKVKKAEKVKWTTEVKCSGCKGTIQEIEPTDIRYRVSDEEALAQHTQIDVVGTFSVICPDCGQQNKIKNIPSVIQSDIRGV